MWPLVLLVNPGKAAHDLAAPFGGFPGEVCVWWNMLCLGQSAVKAEGSADTLVGNSGTTKDQGEEMWVR